MGLILAFCIIVDLTPPSRPSPARAREGALPALGYCAVSEELGKVIVIPVAQGTLRCSLFDPCWNQISPVPLDDAELWENWEDSILEDPELVILDDDLDQMEQADDEFPVPLADEPEGNVE